MAVSVMLSDQSTQAPRDQTLASKAVLTCQGAMSSLSQERERRSNVRRTNVTACARCRSRKQRCDQNIPACSNCERAGAECISTDIDGRVAPRR